MSKRKSNTDPQTVSPLRKKRKTNEIEIVDKKRKGGIEKDPNPNPNPNPNPETVRTPEKKKRKVLAAEIEQLQLQIACLTNKNKKLKDSAAARDEVSFHKMVLQTHEGYESSFRKWRAKLYGRLNGPIKVFQLYKSTKTSNLVQDAVKKQIRAVICFVFDLFRAGFCFIKGTLKEKNLVVAHDDIKLRNLSRRKRDRNAIKENLLELKDFIMKSFFEGREGDIPNDMKRLLYLVEHSGRRKEQVIRNHYALMNEKARRNYLSQCWDIIYQYDDYEWSQYKETCNNLPHQSDWFTLLEKGSSLQKIYKNGVSMGKYSEVPPKSTDQVEYYRHAMAHVLQHCRMGKKKDPARYLYDDCDKMVFVVGWETICMFQELLPDDLFATLKLQGFFDYQ